MSTTNAHPIPAAIMANFQFDLENVRSLDNVASAARYLHVRDAGGEGLAKWIHKFALQYNDPAAGAIAADLFTDNLTALIAEFHQESLAKFGFLAEADTFSFTGNNAFANAYKRVSGAMRWNADLREIDTVSKCQTFVTKAKKDALDNEQMAQKRKSATLLAERAGHKPGTPEFEQYVDNVMAVDRPTLVAGRGTKQSELDTGEVKDQYATYADTIAEQLRKIAKLDENLVANIQRSIDDKLKAEMQKAVNNFAAAQLQKVG